MGSTKNNADRERYVIKLGGSVLADDQAYKYQALRVLDFANTSSAERVYVVLSARKDHTDELADSLCSSTEERESLRHLLKNGDYSNPKEVARFDSPDIARYLLNGEIESMRQFEKELKKLINYPGILLQGYNFPIIANGCYLHADVDFEASEQTGVLDRINTKIVLVPGFAAQNYNGEKVLLGRNASDYVAALLGNLDKRVHEVIYLKDVPGVFENFGTEQERVIEEITAAELLNMGCSEVLDERCLQHMNGYRIRVQHCESEIGKGGTIILH